MKTLDEIREALLFLYDAEYLIDLLEVTAEEILDAVLHQRINTKYEVILEAIDEEDFDNE